MGKLLLGHRFWQHVHRDLDLGDTSMIHALGQSHDTLLGQGQQ